jgi:hypothetical protein
VNLNIRYVSSLVALAHTLARGGKNVLLWLPAFTVGAYETCRVYPLFGLFAFSGILAGFFLSIGSFPIHGTAGTLALIGAIFGIISFTSALYGFARFADTQYEKVRKALELRLQNT